MARKPSKAFELNEEGGSVAFRPPSAKGRSSPAAPARTDAESSAAKRRSQTRQSERRFGAKDSATRAKLVRAGIEVLQSEGSAAFTARRVAEQAGLKPQLVHYYFRTIEDLVLALMQHWGAESLRRALEAVDTDEPLRGLWRAANSERSAALVTEVKALAQQSEAIHAETIRQMEQHRILMSEAIERHLERRGRRTAIPGVVIVMICDALARMLVGEKVLGFTLGHDQLSSLVEEWLDNYYASQHQNEEDS